MGKIQVISDSLEKYPKDLNKLFNEFALIVVKDGINISEIGPRENLSTTFLYFKYEFKVFFETQNSKLIISYTGRKYFLKNYLKSLIINSLNKAKDSVPKERISRIEEDESMEISSTDQASKTKKGILVFVSYATKDANLFRIQEIAETLTTYDKIEDVLYWQEDMKDNIIKYMNDNLDKCDLMILFCSPNALKSKPVETEWTAAESSQKPIIPVFIKPEHIPMLLKSRLGVEFDNFDFQKTVNEIYKLILKKKEEIEKILA
ncbi:MAG: toll/interleukin-1 receptor domain-containing protein [Promethearchaeota archaeon]